MGHGQVERMNRTISEASGMSLKPQSWAARYPASTPNSAEEAISHLAKSAAVLRGMRSR